MDIKKLDDSFYQQNQGLAEILYKPGENTDQRGYAIVLISINNLTFGIPLRTSMPHKYGFKTKENKALDYTKAVLITDNSFISNTFFIPHEEFVMIQNSAETIRSDFESYVEGYIKLIKTGSKKAIESRMKYKYSTLVNYHAELGI